MRTATTKISSLELRQPTSSPELSRLGRPLGQKIRIKFVVEAISRNRESRNSHVFVVVLGQISLRYLPASAAYIFILAEKPKLGFEKHSG